MRGVLMSFLHHTGKEISDLLWDLARGKVKSRWRKQGIQQLKDSMNSFLCGEGSTLVPYSYEVLKGRQETVLVG
jgi:hypothetical protein